MRIATDVFLQCHVVTAELYDLAEPPPPSVFLAREPRVISLLRRRLDMPLWLRAAVSAWMLVMAVCRFAMRSTDWPRSAGWTYWPM